jgi:hypothetical protein
LKAPLPLAAARSRNFARERPAELVIGLLKPVLSVAR